jgi:hypothetical protein
MLKDKSKSNETLKDYLAFLAEATKEVRTWPDWRRRGIEAFERQVRSEEDRDRGSQSKHQDCK